jgi:quinoprotein dehydrogenase-associated probable ABC transporter substrate-binding protein
MEQRRNRSTRLAAVGCAFACLVIGASAYSQGAATLTPNTQGSANTGAPAAKAGAVLKVCADPDNMPQSDQAGAGYENKLAEALARDLGRRVEYTFFPQRMGFVRNTLRARDDATQEFKCDVIIGVPKGYDLTATTQAYMRSTYALVVPTRAEFNTLTTAEDLLKLPKEKLQSLRFGIFARTPATDWLLRNGLIDRAKMYTPQSGDPSEHPANIVERDLESGDIDLAIVWGPVAGFLADRHQGAQAWRAVAFKPDPQIRFDYEIAMGVRFGEREWKDTLDQWISGHRPDIEKILVSYRVPLLEVALPATSPPATH